MLQYLLSMMFYIIFIFHMPIYSIRLLIRITTLKMIVALYKNVFNENNRSIKYIFINLEYLFTRINTL